jgi:MtN3 and saliva related transmembrane protein
MQQYIVYLGVFSGICTGVSLLPQLVKLLKEKKAEGLSLGTFIVLLAGLAGWVIYGLLKQDWPIIITNAFSFCTNIVIIICALKYRHK